MLTSWGWICHNGGFGAPASTSRTGAYTYPSPNHSAAVIHCAQNSTAVNRTSRSVAGSTTRASGRSAWGS